MALAFTILLLPPPIRLAATIHGSNDVSTNEIFAGPGFAGQIGSAVATHNTGVPRLKMEDYVSSSVSIDILERMSKRIVVQSTLTASKVLSVKIATGMTPLLRVLMLFRMSPGFTSRCI